jgi:hypothetical protein
MARRTNDNDPQKRRLVLATRHKYSIGQRVHFFAPNIERSAAGIYRIVAHLPHDYGEQQYRIKSTTSTQERVAQESQLTAIEGL